MRWQRFLLALGGSAALAACSIFTSLEGFTGGADSALDGASSVDGPAGMGSEGGTEASSDEGGGGDGGSWCATHAAGLKYCEDFDTHGLAPYDDPDHRVENGGSATLLTTGASSPPNAFSAMVGGSQNGTNAYIQVDNLGVISSATVATDVRFDKLSSTSAGAQLLKVFFDYGPATFEVGIVFVDGLAGAYEYDNGSSVFNGLGQTASKVPLGKWIRVSLTAHLTGNHMGTVDASIDGVPFVTGAKLTLNPKGSGGATFLYGIPFASGGQDGWRFVLDNVTFDPK